MPSLNGKWFDTGIWFPLYRKRIHLHQAFLNHFLNRVLNRRFRLLWTRLIYWEMSFEIDIISIDYFEI
jgi:hypothetical protein